MPAQQHEWTADMVRALPDDGNRYELLNGELLVSPSPTRRHQTVLKRLLLVIEPYVLAHNIGWAHLSPADIELSPGDTLQPDLFVERGADEEPTDWPDGSKLLLVVEALSPSTARNDRMKKRPAYQEAAIPEYWILDIDARLVERWRPHDDRPEVIGDVLEWHPIPDAPALRIVLDEIFGR